MDFVTKKLILCTGYCILYRVLHIFILSPVSCEFGHSITLGKRIDTHFSICKKIYFNARIYIASSVTPLHSSHISTNFPWNAHTASFKKFYFIWIFIFILFHFSLISKSLTTMYIGLPYRKISMYETLNQIFYSRYWHFWLWYIIRH